MKSRIMYIERKPDEISGEARIGKVSFSKTGRSMYYDGKEFLKIKSGFKHNSIEIISGDEYWISGCKKKVTTPYMVATNLLKLMLMFRRNAGLLSETGLILKMNHL